MTRKSTLEVLKDYELLNETGVLIEWTPGQVEIIDTIIHRSSSDGKKRVQIIAATRYGKSLAVGAGISIRASLKPEKWAIVAGTKEKARIIMEYVTMFSLDSPPIRAQLDIDMSLDRLRMRRSQDRLSYRRRGEVRVYSADARRVANTSTSLMGFGAPNVIEDESALVPDTLQATIMRMLGDQKDNFLCKIGNPFNRNHFLRTWRSDRYAKISIDYRQGLKEGRYSQEFIDEMKEEALFGILYDCKFPEEGVIDFKGWMPLLTDTDIKKAFVKQDSMFGEKRFGCDVAGGGRNFSVIVERAYNVAKKIYKKNQKDTMVFATDIINLAQDRLVKDNNIFIDKIGIGRGASDRAQQLRNKVQGVAGSNSPADKFRFANLRAEMFWRAREWILGGGKLEEDDDWFQLTQIKYKVDSSGKLIMMSKQEMLREGIDSPDVADALSLTFARADVAPALQKQQDEYADEDVNLDPYEKLGGDGGYERL